MPQIKKIIFLLPTNFFWLEKVVSYDQMSPCWIWWSNTLSGHYWRHQNGVTSKKWHSHELHFSDIINDSCCVETCYKLAKKRQWNAGVDYICVNGLAKLLCWVVSGSSTHHDTLGNLTWYIKNPWAHPLTWSFA